MSRVFVTGTDTEVGKTFVSCALLHAAQQAGLSTCAMKPIASGCEVTKEGLRNEDALALSDCATIKLPYEQVNPYAFKEAIAPHVAAKLANKPLEPSQLIKHTQAFLKTDAEFHLIEGAGGWRVPINENESYYFSDYAKDLNIPVILVVSIRLGCINHALLSSEAIQQSGLNLLGWVANRIPADDNDDHFVVQQNITSIKSAISAPLLAEIPEQKHLSQEAARLEAAQQFSESSLKHIFEGGNA